MLKYSANLSTIYREAPISEAFQLVSEAGLNAVEFLFVSGYGLEKILSARDEFGLEIALFDLEIADRTFKTHAGFLSDPSAADDFKRSLDDALKAAQRLDCHLLNALAGKRIPDMGWEKQRDIAVQRLRDAAPLAASAGVTLLVEAIAATAVPGYLVNHSRQALEIVGLVDQPNVLFQDDLYHMQLSEGNLISTLKEHLNRIGHVQIADVPGRHEPGTGEINFANVLKALDEAGYTGYVGLEYIPIGADPFAWMDGLERDEPYLHVA